jgi:hypothetical protein
MQQDSTLPEGWQQSFLDAADLDKSFGALRRCDHFYAEVMRGRIRSLQLRVDEAERYFQRACASSEEAEETIPNLLRQFMLHTYRFYNILLRGPIEPDDTLPGPLLPEIGDAVLREYPELREVVKFRLRAEGLLRLHLADYDVAAELFEDLIESEADGPPDALVAYYLGLAAAHYNRGFDDLAERQLENAALGIQSGGRTLNRALAAGVLHGLYTYMEEPGEAAGWEQFLQRLECPQATRDVFLERGRLIVERSMLQSRLVLL